VTGGVVEVAPHPTSKIIQVSDKTFKPKLIIKPPFQALVSTKLSRLMKISLPGFSRRS